MAMVFSLRAPPACFRPRLSLCQNLYSNPQKMAKIGGVSSTATPYTERKLPILLFDVMDTVVRDPFYHDVPAFFGFPCNWEWNIIFAGVFCCLLSLGLRSSARRVIVRMTLKELIECKHPTAWMEFEKGIIDEMELARKLFKDGRPFDLEGLKSCMKSGYSYIEGVEELLLSLKQNNYEMHAFTNYPTWYQLIEDKLKLSKYLSWTFCSCKNGKRKPDPEFYMEVLGHLKVDPSNCIFMDDRMKNVEVATELGIRGIHFKNANALREELYLMGIDI